MFRAMSGEAPPDEPKPASAEAKDDGAGDVLPVEVEAPDAPKAEEATPEPDPKAELEAKLATTEKEKKDNWEKYLRAAADIENMRKRQKRELDDAKTEAKFKVLKEMLPVVDNLERAMEHATQGGEVDPKLKGFVEGVQLVLRQFGNAFERLEVQAVDAMDQPFDPNQHEAISQQESDKAPGTVVQVLQRGYKSGDRLLRPALVVVAKAKAQAE
jgi:molecular chaperone GrpE